MTSIPTFKFNLTSPFPLSTRQDGELGRNTFLGENAALLIDEASLVLSFRSKRTARQRLIGASFETSAQIRHGYKLGLGLFAYAAFVTVTYVYFVHDPVFHQVSYGLLVVIIVGRSTYLVRRLPLSETRRILVFVLRTAASSFLGAFILWNIDNIFCSSLRGWRKNLGIYPVGAVSELHGWWHIGTALGCYYYIVFNEWIQQILAGNSQVFELHWALGFVPYIRKAEGSVKTAANDHVETKKKK
ncbi:ceramidase-domain-containing protein [Jimgerdemannia flammicorona]|uniref:Ceramidase-domain-containing protein n=1 Tax=Jimgerdemannia flammicorona TaxID=994334 RepID=A0A433DFK3_9FUNG|nr:ceramidase-domain-containing protein [Jimgerdemannia flammicorona]